MLDELERELGIETFDDGRGRLLDRLKIPVPVGMRDVVKRTAAEQGMNTSEFVRMAILASVRAARSKEQAA